MSVTTTAITVVNGPTDTVTNGSTGVAKGDENTFQWLLAWAVMLVLLTLANKTRFGHTVIYYGMSLLLLFLVVTQYKFIANALAPVGTSIPVGDK